MKEEDLKNLPDTVGEPSELVAELPGLGSSLVGSILSWVAIGLFYLTCIVLPLVGQAGKETPHDRMNYVTFFIVVVLALLVSLGALFSRVLRRKAKGGALPWIQIGLVAVNGFILLMLFSKRLGI